MITVAIPFYNAERYLAEAIESVLIQTYTEWELLLVDDGSTDGSLKIANKYSEIDSRIRVISDGLNKNLGSRLNEIPFIVRTIYLARMDADDIMHPQRLEKQYKILQDHYEINVLGTNAYSIDENSKVVGIRINPKNQPELIKVKGFIHPTIMAKNQWFKDNPYDVKFLRLEDTELWMRSVRDNNFMILTEPLFYYREFGNRYFLKYFKGLKSIFYLVLKHKFSLISIIFFLKYILATIRSYLYYLLGIEAKFIINRNQIKFNKSKSIGEN